MIFCKFMYLLPKTQSIQKAIDKYSRYKYFQYLTEYYLSYYKVLNINHTLWIRWDKPHSRAIKSNIGIHHARSVQGVKPGVNNMGGRCCVLVNRINKGYLIVLCCLKMFEQRGNTHNLRLQCWGFTPLDHCIDGTINCRETLFWSECVRNL